MTAQNLIKYWQIGAERDFDVGSSLFRLKNYSHCLFICHLSLEKLIKGLVYKKTLDFPPPIHNLVNLLKLAKITTTPEILEDFKEISSWNIEARYDNIKFAFYKKATMKFADKWFTKVKEYYQWLKSLY